MSTQQTRSGDNGLLLHPELLARDDGDAIYRNGHRLDHAEGLSKPLRAEPEPQPRRLSVREERALLRALLDRPPYDRD